MHSVKSTRTTLLLVFAVAAIAATAHWVFRSPDGLTHSTDELLQNAPATDDLAAHSTATDVKIYPGNRAGSDARNMKNSQKPDPIRTFGESYPELISAAANGDRSATIVLAKGLAACRDRFELRTRYGDLRSRAERHTKIATSPNATDNDKKSMDQSILAMDEAKLRLDAVETACAGIPESAIKARWHHQLAAAKTGDADMIFDFLAHPAMDPREAFGDDSGIRAYRENAPALLDKLIRDGDLRGYQAYVRAGYDSLMRRENYRFHDALSRVLKPDPVRVLAYDIALGQSGLVGGFGSGPDHDALRNRQLDPAQRISAEAMARQIAPDVAASVSNWLQSNPPQPRGG